MRQYFLYQEPFLLESGKWLPEIKIAYCTYGRLHKNKSNVVWVCHALTASADVEDWWPGVVGKGCAIDTEKYFVVCANILGSCYGSTGPLSNDPLTGKPYHASFPAITIRDLVKAHQLLASHLGIDEIQFLVGGSMGGYQAMEWAWMDSTRVKQLVLLATSAKESAWGVAIHTAQRMAIEADGSFGEAHNDAGSKGLKAARAMGMLTYRSYELMEEAQAHDDINALTGFKAESYIQYQGEKLVRRFNAYSYHLLTRAMDTHNLARNRTGKVSAALAQLPQRTLIIGIIKDMLCPIAEQRFLQAHIVNSTLVEINSLYGHDGFLTEGEKIGAAMREWGI